MVEASPATLGPDGRQDGRRPIAAMDGAPPNRTEQNRAEQSREKRGSIDKEKDATRETTS